MSGNKHIGSSVESLFEELGEIEEVKAKSATGALLEYCEFMQSSNRHSAEWYRSANYNLFMAHYHDGRASAFADVAAKIREMLDGEEAK